MSEEGMQGWVRRDLGNDEGAWAWAMSQIARSTIMALATMSEAGPRVRPVTAVPFDGEVYVLTSTHDAKVRQLDGDPRFEFYVLVREGDRTGYVRFSGRAERVEDPGLRRRVGDEAGFVDEYWKGPDDPDMTVLRMGIEAAEVVRPGIEGWEMLSR